MKFTIAIPTYNNSTTIREVVESAINQCFDQVFEVLVVDNCSSDNTQEILDNYNDSIIQIRNNKTVSMYENHNICLEKAKGDYVIFCHSDDILLPDALTKYFNVLEKRNFPARYVLWGRSMFRDFFYNWKNAGFRLNQISSGMNSVEVFLTGGVTPSGTCYARKSFLSSGGFVNTNHYLAPSDWVTMWKLSINYFEFEMSDRIFFKREDASTASNENLNSKKNLDEASKDAILNLLKTLSKRESGLILNYFYNSIYYPYILIILFNRNFISRKKLIRKIMKHLFFNPVRVFKIATWQLFIRILMNDKKL